MNYLGVSRTESYSPHRISDDAAVFRAVVSELERCGNNVICLTEQDLTANGIPKGVDGIFQMARSCEALSVLEHAGVPVTNTVQAVRNCGRAVQTRLLGKTGYIPESVVCHTTGIPDSWHIFPCWLKRADSHAVEQNDVLYIENRDQCAAAMRGFAARGLSMCVLQAHAKGWLVKFYGIRGMGLKDCFAASPNDGKFGLERYNEQPDCASVDIQSLSAVVEHVSEILGVDVYGGDAVVGADGGINIVDFNDWPSFRSCTVGAAQQIARLIMNKNK